MDALPAELLECVLALLPPADLVACRAVCARWRAVVRALEAADARCKLDCGLRAHVASGRLAFRRRETFDPALRATYAGADESTRRSLDQKFDRAQGDWFVQDAREIVRSAVAFAAKALTRDDDDTIVYLMPCACGRPSPAWCGPRGALIDDDVEGKDAQSREPSRAAGAGTATAGAVVGHRHRHVVPLARWRYLAGELALAQQLADICGPLDARLFLAGFDYNGDQEPWFPYFLHLQSRPVGALLARATSIEGVVDALTMDPEIAAVFRPTLRDDAYAFQPFAAWWPRRRERLDDRVADWATAARSNVAAAVFVYERMYYAYGPTDPWMGMTSAQLTEGLEAQQRHFDAMVAAFERLVRFPFVVRAGTEQHYCIVGLSPSANLVGVRVTLDYR